MSKKHESDEHCEHDEHCKHSHCHPCHPCHPCPPCPPGPPGPPGSPGSAGPPGPPGPAGGLAGFGEVYTLSSDIGQPPPPDAPIVVVPGNYVPFYTNGIINGGIFTHDDVNNSPFITMNANGTYEATYIVTFQGNGSKLGLGKVTNAGMTFTPIPAGAFGSTAGNGQVVGDVIFTAAQNDVIGLRNITNTALTLKKITGTNDPVVTNAVLILRKLA